LDYPALVCITEVYKLSILVFSVVDGKLFTYHVGKDVQRPDGRVIALSLVHDHWAFIHGRENHYWPNWWLRLRATPPSLDTLLGGMLCQRHARVDASTAALQLVGGADAADDDEVGRDEFSEGSISK
jgi:hypothetical protein